MLTHPTRKRFRHLLAALAGSASLALSAGSAQAADPVKIGYLIPLSGTAAAAIGQEMSRATHLAVKHINAEGGIKALGGAPLQLVEVDSRGDARVGITEAERLITVEKVPVMIGAFQSSVTVSATAVAERYQVPWIVDLAAAANITERGFRYVFRPVQVPSSGNAASTADFIEWARDNLDVQPKTAAILYENTDWGQDLADTLRKRFTEMGLRIVLDESYPPNSANLRPLVVKLKGAKPDVISVTAYTADSIQIQRLMEQLQVDAQMVIGSAAGHADRTFVPTVGERGTNFVFTTNGWAGYDATVKTPFAKRFWDDYMAAHQMEPTEFGVSAYGAVWILKDALERAGKAEPKAIRDALAATELRGTDLTGLLGYDVIFDETNQNTAKRFAVQQIQDGRYKTVWPPELRAEDTEIVWPAPAWRDR